MQDRLFAYALLQYAELDDVDTYGNIFSDRATPSSQEVPTWLVKLDWNINDSHILELTGVLRQDRAGNGRLLQPAGRARSRGQLGSGRRHPGNPYPPLTPATTDLPAGLPPPALHRSGTVFNETGGDSYSLKYTGYLTDNFTLSALYGHGESSRANYGVSANGIVAEYDGDVGGPVAGCPIIQSTWSTGVPPNCSFIGLLGTKGAQDERDQFRIDAEWALGDHLIRFGYDADKFTSIDGEAVRRRLDLAVPLRLPQRRLHGDPPARLRRARVPVRRRRSKSTRRRSTSKTAGRSPRTSWPTSACVGTASRTSTATARPSSRSRTSSARASASRWDVNGDSSFKVYGNAGRYSLPLTATVAVRGASPRCSWSSSTPSPASIRSPAPRPASSRPASISYLNNEFGLGKDAAHHR